MAASSKTSVQAVAYLRTSSAANVDGDSAERQRAAIREHAERAGLDVVAEFYDAAVSGADPVDQRPGFAAMLNRIEGNGVRAVLVENASRFARDLAVQLTGHALLRTRGIELVPADCPTYFTDPSPTAEMVRQILGSVSQFEKASLVAKLRAARDRVKAATGRCEGRKPSITVETLAALRRLARRNPRTGLRRSLRTIAAELAVEGFRNPETGRPYSHQTVRQVLAAREAA